MVKLEKLNTHSFSYNQSENKILYSNHYKDVSMSYKSTYTLKYVIEGEKHYNYNNQNIQVLKNQYVIINNNNQITTNAKKGTKGLSFFLSKKLIHEIYSYYNITNSSIEFLEVIHNKSNSPINYLLHKTALLYKTNPLVLEQLMDIIFIEISELIVKKQIKLNDNFLHLKIIKKHTQKEIYQKISNTEHYINDNFKENISLENISKDIGISKYYLHRLFSEINGETPLSYLTNVRLKRAKNKLKYSKESILQIAISCGFDNAAYFSTIFKKHTGMSPTYYRDII